MSPETITKDYLYQLYIVEKKSVLDISRLINKSIKQVSRYLKKFDIPTRPFSTTGLKTRLGAKLTLETKSKIANSHIGKHHSVETKKKMGSKGSKNGSWKGGITPINKILRNSIEYKLWRQAVYKRDNFKCIWCGKKGVIHADHIKPFAYFPELRFAIDNGRTLCIDCHRKTETYGNKKIKH
jgi:hypothetical protein